MMIDGIASSTSGRVTRRRTVVGVAPRVAATRSRHYVSDPELRHAIAQALARETYARWGAAAPALRLQDARAPQAAPAPVDRAAARD